MHIISNHPYNDRREKPEAAKRRRLHRLITSVVTGLITINVAIAGSDRPRLVVGIMVDQLRTDYLEYLRDYFGNKGFKRLMDNGAYLPDVDFRALVEDSPTATAAIYTGSRPAFNGVSSAYLYDPVTRRALPALSDPSTLGNYTDTQLSPSPLQLSTISDEVAIDGIGLGLVYAVAADPQTAIIMAGHAGNGALWLDDKSGNWCSTAYYRDLPQHITRRNHYNPLPSRIDTIRWQPVMDVAKYPGVPAQKRHYPFSYMFSRSDKNVYTRFAQSAPGNREVTDVAIETIESLGLGSRGDAIDMINVAYSAGPFGGVTDGDYRLELEDTYLRLDSEIGRLLDVIDRKAGLENTVIFVCSTGYYNDATRDDPKYRVPGGEISLKRLESLLNSYLSAKYGNGDYVTAVHHRQIYLDEAVIEQKGLRLADVREDAREFVVKMSGVASARTITEILADTSGDNERLRLTLDPKKAGDIYLYFNPGWNVVDDQSYPSTVTPMRNSAPLTPAIIMAPGVAARTFDRPVDAAAIAPTVCSILHIRSPNGVCARPLNLRVTR